MKRLILWLATLAACGVLRVPAAISVGPNGTGLWTFDTAPAVTEWATLSLPGLAPNIVSYADLDLAVQSLSAADFTNALPPTATLPPSAHGLARFNTSGKYLQTRPTAVGATVLMATLQNEFALSGRLTISYRLRVENLPEATIGEEVPGLRAYYSLSGSPGSWQWIPGLSQSVPDRFEAQVNVGWWEAGASLFLLWADDNAAATVTSSPEEGAYALDDFSVVADGLHGDPVSGVVITYPMSGQSFPEGTWISFYVDETPGITIVTNVALYDGTNFIDQWPGPMPSPLRLVYRGATPGLHQCRAVGISSGFSVTSAPVSITVFARPSLGLSVSASGVGVVSWPESFTGYELQSASDLRAPVWEKVNDTELTYDGFRHMTVGILTGTRFFRLYKR